MRIDGRENDLPFCYRPQYCGLWAAQHGELFYSYHADLRRQELDRAAEAEPALALAVECCGAMGLFVDCSEMLLAAVVILGCEKADVQRLKESMPRLAAAVRGDKSMLKHLYFSLILPVAAAFDAGEENLARRILLETAYELEKRLLSHS